MYLIIVCVQACAVLEADGIANLVAQLHAHLFTHTLSDRHGGHSARLCAPYQPCLRIPILVQVLGQLGRLAAAGLADNDDNAVVADDIEQVLPHSEDGKVLPLLLDGLGARKVGRGLSLALHVVGKRALAVVCRLLITCTHGLGVGARGVGGRGWGARSCLLVGLRLHTKHIAERRAGNAECSLLLFHLLLALGLLAHKH